MKRPTIETRRRLVGGEGIWTFICADLVVFSLLFLTFASYWPGQADTFATSQAKLAPILGLINTVILLTSSLFVAVAVESFNAGRILAAKRLLLAAALCGVGFTLIKIFEYSSEAGIGALPTTDDFFMYYYVMTGIHLLHVVIGVVALVFIATRLPSATAEAGGALIETGAAFWHLVDLIWVFLFPILYLMS